MYHDYQNEVIHLHNPGREEGMLSLQALCHYQAIGGHAKNDTGEWVLLYDDTGFQLWDLKQKKAVWIMEAPELFWLKHGTFNHISGELDPTGRWMATQLPHRESTTIEIREVPTGKRIRCLETPPEFGLVQFDKTGEKLILFGEDETGFIWTHTSSETQTTLESKSIEQFSFPFDQAPRPSTWKEKWKRRLKYFAGKAHWHYRPDWRGGTCISEQEDALAFGTFHGRIHLFTFPGCELITTITAPRTLIEMISMDHQNGVVFAYGDNEQLYGWDLSGKHPKPIKKPREDPRNPFLKGSFASVKMESLQGHTDRLYRAAFEPTGRWLLTSDFQARICLWDLANGKMIHHHDFPKDHPTAFPEVIPAYPLYPAGQLALHPDGKSALIGWADGTLQVWDLVNWQREEIWPANGSPIEKVEFLGKQELLLSGDQAGSLTARRSDGTIVWQEQLPGPIQDWTWSADETWGLIAAGKELLVFDLKTQTIRNRLAGVDEKVFRIALHEGRSRVAFSTPYFKLFLWDLNPEHPPQEITTQDKTQSCLLFSPDGKYLFASDHTDQVSIWEVEKASLLKRKRFQSTAMKAMHIVGDRLYTLGDNGVLRSWDLEQVLSPEN